MSLKTYELIACRHCGLLRGVFILARHKKLYSRRIMRDNGSVDTSKLEENSTKRVPIIENKLDKYLTIFLPHPTPQQVMKWVFSS